MDEDENDWLSIGLRDIVELFARRILKDTFDLEAAELFANLRAGKDGILGKR